MQQGFTDAQLWGDKPDQQGFSDADLWGADKVPAPAPELSDFGNALQVGAGQAGQSVGYVLKKVGADNLGQSVQDYWTDYAKDQQGQFSAGAKQALSKDMSFGDLGGSLTKAALVGLESAPGMVMTAPLGMGAGAAAGGVARLLAARGIGGSLAAAAAGAAAPTTLATRIAAATPGAIGAGVAEGVQAGASNAAQAEQQVMDTPIDQLRKTPGWDDAVKSTGGNEEKARAALAKTVGDYNFTRSAIATGTLSALMGGGVLGQMVNRQLGTAATQGILRSALSGAGREAIEEAPQNASDQLIQNLGQQKFIDPNQPAWQGVGQQAIEGAVVGGLMGGVTGGTDSAMSRPRGKTAEPERIDPSLEDTQQGQTAEKFNPHVEVSFPDSPLEPGSTTGAQAPIDPAARLQQLDAIAQQRDLTPAESSEVNSLLGGQEQGGAAPADLTPESDLALMGMQPETPASPAQASTTLVDLQTQQPAQPVPPPQAPTIDAATSLPSIKGAPTQFSTDAGGKIDGQYALVDAGSLVTSHDENLRVNPAFPQELQPRARDRAASELQISGIVQKLDPARLGLSADAATGAPIIGPDGIVESGNARTIALKRIYQANGQKAQDYKTFLRDNSASFGMNPQDVDNLQQPVLVRLRTSAVDRAEFTRQANSSTVAQMSPSEQAKSDAARVDSLDGLNPDDSGDFTNAASRDFIRAFMAKLPATEQAGMVDAQGNLSTAGYSRVRNAVLAKAYGDSPTLQRMTESLDDNLRNVSRALLRVAPTVAKARDAIRSGDLHNADLAPHLLGAVEEFSKLKDQGMPVRAALDQMGMFGEDMHPIARDMLQFLDENIRRPNKIAALIQSYYDHLAAAGHPAQQGLLGDTTPPTVGDILTAAKTDLEKDSGQNHQQASIFQPPAGERPAGGNQETRVADEQQRSDAQGHAGRAQGDGLDSRRQAAEVSNAPSEAALQDRQSIPKLKRALKAANTQTFAAGGFTFEPDGRFTKVLHQGEQVASIGGRRTRDAIATAIQNNLKAAQARVKAAPEKAANDAPALSRAAEAGPAMDAELVHGVARAVAAKWANSPDILVVRDLQDKAVPAEVRTYDAQQRSQGAAGEPEGFFYKGKAYIVASQMRSAADVSRVLAHEVLGHSGLRGKFGPALDRVLDQIVVARRSDVLAKAKQYGLGTSQRDLQTAAEEVLAELAQTQPQIGFVRRAVAAIRTWLRAQGLNLHLSDDEIIRNFILPARAWVESQAGVHADSGLAEFSRTRSSGEAAQDQGDKPQSLMARKLKSMMSAERMDGLIYNFQDKFVDLRRLKEHIEQMQGTITDANDAYLGEELYHGKVAKRTADFLSEELRPLLAKANVLNISLPELETYLHARHAPEANRVLAERNPNQEQIDTHLQTAQADVTALANQLASAQAKGSASKAIEQALEQARAELNAWRSAQPFKGVEAERLALSGMSDAQAQQVMEDFSDGKRQRLEQLAAMVDAINAKTLAESRRYGLRDQATIDAFNATYQHYVPLHRDEAHPDTVSHPLGSGFSVKGDGGKRRAGSNEKVTNILAHIAMQREATITRGEKNAVSKQLYLLAKQNPAPDWWSVERPPVKRTVGKNGLVAQTVDPGYKNRDNVVMTRIAGKDVAIVFNEHNPRAVRLAAALKNLDASQVGALLGAVGKATRYFSAVNTQYNPVFGAVNITRDVQAGLLNLSTTEIRGRQAEVAKHIPAALAGIYVDLRSRSAKGKSTHSKWAELFEDFQNQGGQTGYRDLFRDPGERAQSLASEFKRMQRGKISHFARGLAHWLSDYNEALENSVRLAAYKVALDHGVSKPRAASLAKNLTVNFNRKGAKTTQLGSLYAFFNASLQGSERLVRTLRGPMGRQIVAGGLMLGGLQALLGIGLMGGDEWDKIPEFIRERSLILPVGAMLGDGKGYVSIPMPLGFHVIPNFGRLLTEAALGRRQVGDALSNMLGLIPDAFNPLGGSAPLAQIAAPTVLDPAMALLQNKDWTGRAIYMGDFNGLDPTPGTQRSKAGSSAFGLALADAFNKVTGGTDYTPGAFSPTADQIDYVVGQLTGGIGRELMHIDQAVTATATGDELPPYKIPLVGRFYGSTAGQSGQAQAFYDNVTALNEAQNEIVGRAKDGKDVQAYIDTHPLAELGGGSSWSNLVSKLRRAKQDAEKQGDRALAKEFDDQITQTMTQLNQMVEEARH